MAPPVVFTEYLDVTRLPDPALQRAQLEWLRRKYADRPPDAVVAFGTSTARRLELLDAPLFPGVPSVFAALDPLLFPDLALPPGSDALWLRYDVGETLGAALRLQPAARRAVLVAGTSDFDRAMLALARREVAPYAQRVAIEEITDLPLEEVLRRVAALPAGGGGGLPLAQPGRHRHPAARRERGCGGWWPPPARPSTPTPRPAWGAGSSGAR